MFRNWKWTPRGIVIQVLGLQVTSSPLSKVDELRHNFPSPLMKYQISSTFLCATAFEIFPIGKEQYAKTFLAEELSGSK